MSWTQWIGAWLVVWAVLAFVMHRAEVRRWF